MLNASRPPKKPKRRREDDEKAEAMSFFDCLGSVFGGSSVDNGVLRQAALAQIFVIQNAWPFPDRPIHQRHMLLRPGIFWERTGGKTHRVVIRREPEIVIDLSGLGRDA